MIHQDNVQEIREALSQALQCTMLEAEDDGRIMFGLDDDMGVVLFPEGGDELGREVIAATIIIGKPDTSDTELLVDLLEGNYMGALAGDGSLAMDRKSGLLVLFRVFELPMDAVNFVAAFAKLVGAARLWRARLEHKEVEFPPVFDMLRV